MAPVLILHSHLDALLTEQRSHFRGATTMSDVKSSASWAGNARVLLLVHGVAKRFEQSCEVSRMKI